MGGMLVDGGYLLQRHDDDALDCTLDDRQSD